MIVNALGVPILLPGIQSHIPPLVTKSQTQDGANDAALPPSQASQWGVFLHGSLVLEPDSIVSLGYQREWSLSDFPVEQGAFNTYNKVARPFDVRIRMTKGGTLAERTGFQTTLERLAASLDLYDVVTPERTYMSVNMITLGLQRANGAGVSLLTFDLALRQVAVTAESSFSDVVSPTSADPVNAGLVQTVVVTGTKQAAVAAALDLPGDATSYAMSEIPLTVNPAQTLNVALGGVLTTVALYQRAAGMFADLYQNNALIVGGRPCLNGVGLVREPYLGFAGELTFIDNQGAGQDPTPAGLGSRFSMVYVAPPGS